MGRPSLAIACIAIGCGASISSVEGPVARQTDDAVELAALLPERVEQCVIARPSRLTAQQRALVVPYSWAEPLAWDRNLSIVAYASAFVDASGGRRARRTYVRFSRPAPELNLDALGVRMEDAPCEGQECRRPAARWLDARTLQIARYEWAPTAAPPIPISGCVAMARMFPTAIEVAVDTSASSGGIHLPEPRRGSRVLVAQSGALVSRRETVFDDPVEARIFELRVRMRGPSVDSALVPLASSRRTFERDGERVVVSETHLWQELELALEDERLRVSAMAHEARRSTPMPLDRVRVDDVEIVRRQVFLRRAQLTHMSQGERERAMTELVELLRLAWQTHPSELSFALTLAQLHTRSRNDPRAAVAVIDDVLARALPDDPQPWRSLRREALARASVRELADALAADGIASGGEAASAAADLRALSEAGVPYEWAEGAWTTSRELFAGPPPRREIDVRMPFEGALGAMVASERVRGNDHVTVQIAVRTRVRSDAGAIGESRPDLVVVRGPSGGTIYVGALPSLDLVALRRLGAILASAAGSGEIEIAIALRNERGEARILRAIGSRAGDMLAIARASSELASAPWSILVRYIAAPLAEMATALFPPPTLTVRCESAEVASELRRGIEPTHPGACSTAGPVLRCESATALGEVALRVAELRIRQETP